MTDDRVVSTLEALLAAMDECSNVTAGLIARARDTDARLLELSENVATLGLMMQNHATQHLEQHSIRAVPAVSHADLAQLAEELRLELAAEAEQITERIDHVHTKTLRALTDLTERKQHA